MTQLAESKTQLAIADQGNGTIQAFASQGNFEDAQRMAKALSSSSLVPKEYQGNIPNCLIAMEIAGRIGVSVFATMQNLDIIHGRPSWRATFLIATVNASGRFTPLRFRFEGEPNSDSWGCRAVAKDRENKEECVGPLVTIALAKAEGWHGKNGSKWKTLPELMLNYRAAAFWTRVYAPELSLGMQTADEAHDIGAPGAAPADLSDLEAQILSETTADPGAKNLTATEANLAQALAVLEIAPSIEALKATAADLKRDHSWSEEQARVIKTAMDKRVGELKAKKAHDPETGEVPMREPGDDE